MLLKQRLRDREMTVGSWITIGDPVVADGAQELEKPKRLVQWCRHNREIVTTLFVVVSSHRPFRIGMRIRPGRQRPFEI